MNTLQACVILPAAGTGERMGVKTPKQFCNVFNRAIISYTIESFSRVPWISHIIVCIAEQYKQLLQHILDAIPCAKVVIVDGGKTRHRSISNGIKAIDKVCPEVDMVVIHDAVRPLVDEALLLDLVLAANQSGAAGVVRPLVPTVVTIDENGYMNQALDRSKCRSSETPQAFSYAVIKAAYQKCTEHDLDFGTECLQLAQRYVGVKVGLVEGPEMMEKVTHRKDLFAFESHLKAKVNEVRVSIGQLDMEVATQYLEYLKNALQAKLYQEVPVIIASESGFAIAAKAHEAVIFVMFYKSIASLSSYQFCCDLSCDEQSCMILIHVLLVSDGASVDAVHLMDIVKQKAKCVDSRNVLTHALAVKVTLQFLSNLV